MGLDRVNRVKPDFRSTVTGEGMPDNKPAVTNVTVPIGKNGNTQNAKSYTAEQVFGKNFAEEFDKNTKEGLVGLTVQANPDREEEIVDEKDPEVKPNIVQDEQVGNGNAVTKEEPKVEENNVAGLTKEQAEGVRKSLKTGMDVIAAQKAEKDGQGAVVNDEVKPDAQGTDEATDPKTAAVIEAADNRKAQQAKTEEAKKAEDKPEAKQAEAKPAEKDPLDEKLQRAIRYDDKDAIKACQAEIADRFKYKYNEYGDKLIATDDETAAKKAKSYVENAKKADKFERTILTNSGAECTLVKNELKAKKEALIAQYQAEGLSKKEAKKRAEAELPNRVVDLSDHAVLFGVVKKGYRKAYNFINRPENRERFFYENGRLNSDAVKAFFRDEVANADTDFEGGEVTNFRATLPEQGKAAAKYNVKRSAMGQGARAAGLYSDKDRTPLYVAGFTVAGTAIGAGVGAVLSGSAATLSGAAANAAATTACAEATADAVAGAGAYVSWNLVGAGAATGGGVGLGLSRFLTDKGRKEDRVYGFYRKPEPVQQGKVANLGHLKLNVPKLDLTQTVTLPEKEEDCQTYVTNERVCYHTIQKDEPGIGWWHMAKAHELTVNGKPANGNQLNAYTTANRLRYEVGNLGKTDILRIGETYALFTDFSEILTEENYKKYPILRALKAEDVIDFKKCDTENQPKATGGRLINISKAKAQGINANPYIFVTIDDKCTNTVTREKRRINGPQ